MNRVVLVGRLTRDPELRNTNSGVPVVSFTIAVNRTFTSSQSGEREADFINCICFNKQAENLNRFIKKGGLVGVDGRIQTRSYTAQDGSKRYVTEVVCENMRMLENRNSNSNSSYLDEYEPADYGYQKDTSDEESINSTPENDVDFNISEDDLPF